MRTFRVQYLGYIYNIEAKAGYLAAGKFGKLFDLPRDEYVIVETKRGWERYDYKGDGLAVLANMGGKIIKK